MIINDDDYWVHYVGWNKKYDDIVHVEIIRAKSDVLPEVNRNEKGKSKRSKEIMKELEPKKKLDDPGFKSSKSAKKPAPTKRKAASTASATPPVSKRSKINTPVTTSKRHRTSSTAQLVENGFDDVENGSRTSGRLGLKSAKSPMPKIKWATQKKDMIATMKSNGVDKDAIDEIVRKWSHDINKAINRITQKHIGNQSEYRYVLVHFKQLK